jgi:hypothetical protein
MLLGKGHLLLSGSPSLLSWPFERVMVMSGVAKKSWRNDRLSRRVTTDAIGTRILAGITVRFAHKKENESMAVNALRSVDRQVHLMASQLATKFMNCVNRYVLS